MLVFRNVLLTGILFFAWALDSKAHPIIYKGGYVGSVMLHSDYSHLHSNYSLTSKEAIGVNYESFRRFDENGEVVNDEYFYVQGNKLLKRFYQDDSQGNIYAKIGAGQHIQGAKATYYAGLQADWETRTIYTAFKSDTLFSQETIDQQRSSASFGLSPYEASYNEMQAWLIFQLEHRRNDDKDLRITPMMRFFYKTALWELGSDLDGNWLMHYMIHI